MQPDQSPCVVCITAPAGITFFSGFYDVEVI